MLLVLNKTAYGVVCDVACWLYKGMLLLSDFVWFCGTHVNKTFVYTRKKGVNFSLPIFIKFTFAELCYVDIFCTKFHPNWVRSMEIVGRN